MKKKLVLVGLLSFTVLFGCTQVSNDVEAGVSNGFVQVSYDRSINETSLSVIQHNDTGCYYILGDGGYSGGVPVQMMIEKDGVTVPYCEK